MVQYKRRARWFLFALIPLTLACALISSSDAGGPETPPAPASAITQTNNKVETQPGELNQGPTESTSQSAGDEPEAPVEEQTGVLPISAENIRYLRQDEKILPGKAEMILFSPDGGKIATLTHGGEEDVVVVTFFDYPSGAVLSTREIKGLSTVLYLYGWMGKFSPDSGSLIYEEGGAFGPVVNGSIRIFETTISDTSPRLVREIQGHNYATEFTVSPNGEILILPDDLPPFISKPNDIIDVKNIVVGSAWTPDGSGLVSLFIDSRVYFWDRKNEENSRWLQENQSIGSPLDIVFQSDGARLLGIFKLDTERTNEIHDLTTGTVIGKIPISENETLTFILDGAVIAGWTSSRVKFYLPSGEIVGSIYLQDSSTWILSLADSPDHTVLALGTDEGVRFYQIAIP